MSSESADNGKFVRNAIDGNPRTWWHTRFSVNLARSPHEIVIDLGGEHTVTGIRYLARQDRSWNGTIKDIEVYVGGDPKRFGKPAAKGRFKKTKKAQEVDFPPVRGRYVMLRALSEVNGGPWASASEIGIIGE